MLIAQHSNTNTVITIVVCEGQMSTHGCSHATVLDCTTTLRSESTTIQ